MPTADGAAHEQAMGRDARGAGQVQHAGIGTSPHASVKAEAFGRRRIVAGVSWEALPAARGGAARTRRANRVARARTIDPRPARPHDGGMCTLLLGVGVPEHGTLLVGANRDEDPHRPSDPPMALRAHPPVAGGRDRVSGGTWLAVRGREAVIAVLNRRVAAPDPPLRSRGLLALDVAAADDPLRALHQATAGEAYGPWSLVRVDRFGGWVAQGGDDAGRGVTRVVPLDPGWHVLTHTQLDDPAEPRAAWLEHELANARPRDADEGLALLARLLAIHGGDGVPAVCLHGGRMPTRSSARICLGRDEARWWHAEGPPCVTPWQDVTSLLAAESAR